MRGQRPALSGLLLWIALLIVMLGALPLVPVSGPAEAQVTLQQRETEDRGGELPLDEQAPVKLRRTALHAPVRNGPPQRNALLAAAPSSSVLTLPATRLSLAANDWPLVRPAPPSADAPGRRQQRGQAPPRA